MSEENSQMKNEKEVVLLPYVVATRLAIANSFSFIARAQQLTTD